MSDDFNLDNLLERLVAARGERVIRPVEMKEAELHALCQKTADLFKEQPMLLELAAPVKIVGDVHGQYYDLLRLFEFAGFPPESNYLFLGDYVDRGKQSIETVLKYPENFFMLRGNHECASINRMYGFYDECKARYSVKLWKAFNNAFNYMPLAAVVDDSIFCVHAGMSPELKSMDQIRSIERPTDIPDDGLLCDLLWADPNEDIKGWAESDRGVSFTFGEEYDESDEDAPPSPVRIVSTRVTSERTTGPVKIAAAEARLLQPNTTKHALQQRSKSVTYELKRFHNSRKRELVQALSWCADAVLDLACGRGGDIQKWLGAGVQTVLGIDISANEVEEARARYKAAAKGRGMASDAYQFKQSSGLGKTPLMEWGRKYQSVSCQFSLHYFFASEATLSAFL
eukprot:gene17895-32368_t